MIIEYGVFLILENETVPKDIWDIINWKDKKMMNYGHNSNFDYWILWWFEKKMVLKGSGTFKRLAFLEEVS